MKKREEGRKEEGEVKMKIVRRGVVRKTENKGDRVDSKVVEDDERISSPSWKEFHVCHLMRFRMWLQVRARFLKESLKRLRIM